MHYPDMLKAPCRSCRSYRGGEGFQHRQNYFILGKDVHRQTDNQVNVKYMDRKKKNLGFQISVRTNSYSYWHNTSQD